MNYISRICTKTQELHRLTEAYRQADINRIQAQRDCEHIQADLLDLMRTPGGAVYEDDELHATVCYVPESHKTIIDTSRLRAEHPELWEAYSKESIVKERIVVQCDG